MSTKIVKLASNKSAGAGNNGDQPPMPPTDYITRTEFDAAMKNLDLRLEQGASKADVAELRADMHEGFSTMVKWVVGAAMVLGATGITVMTFVLNNAIPKAPQTSPHPPVIINLPAAPAPNVQKK